MRCHRINGPNGPVILACTVDFAPWFTVLFVRDRSLRLVVLFLVSPLLTPDTRSVWSIVLAMSDYVVPSFGSLQVHSPLESLVRRTSSRRRPNAPPSPLAEDGTDFYPPAPLLDAPPRRHSNHPPPSPLLHTSFRASIATQSSSYSSAEPYGYTRSHMSNGSQDIPFDDDSSVYSVSTATIPNYSRTSNIDVDKPEAIASSSSRGRVRNSIRRTPPRHSGAFSDATDERYERRSTDSATDPFMYQRSRSQNSSAVPTVVVSVEDSDEAINGYDDEQGNALSSPSPDSKLSAGRTPSAVPRNMNFSRPGKPGGASEEAKRQVLARNAFRSTSTYSSLKSSEQPRLQSSPHRMGEPSQLEATQITEITSGLSPSSSSMPPTRRPSNPRAAAGSHLVPLMRGPPSVSSSSNSVYSMYSYYQLDSPSPSPTSETLQVPPSPHDPPPRTPPTRTPSPMNPASAPKADPERLVLADQLLQEGIQHHEANRLRQAAAAFERSAKTPGGSGVGMLMWGLTLRHGWGCPKDEVLGFSWLRRAAQSAVGDLERARTGIDTSAVRGELVFAIYEVGQCFFHGWGVKKDQKMAVVSYFLRSFYFWLWAVGSNPSVLFSSRIKPWRYGRTTGACVLLC